MFAAIFAAVAVVFSSPVFRMTDGDAAKIADSRAVISKKLPAVVIDAGHGGIDGGAVAPDGTCEKDINLDIALMTEAILRSAGIECIMTRISDTMCSDGKGPGGKMSDLSGRVSLTEGRKCVFLSIHQNKFPQESCYGTQVYYSKNDPDSKILADRIQSGVRELLQSGNARQIKAAGSEIYVLDRCTVPAVLVECGFLSNPAELEKLKDPVYREELACVIGASVYGFLTDTRDK